jgi:hypothetical protein
LSGLRQKIYLAYMTACMVLQSYYSLQLLPACSVSLRKGSSILKRYNLLEKIPDRSIRAKKNETPDHAWIQCNSIHRSRLLFGTKREKLKREVQWTSNEWIASALLGKIWKARSDETSRLIMREINSETLNESTCPPSFLCEHVWAWCFFQTPSCE